MMYEVVVSYANTYHVEADDPQGAELWAAREFAEEAYEEAVVEVTEMPE